MELKSYLKWFLTLWKVPWLRGWLLRITVNILKKLKGECIMELTPNTNVSEIESLGFSVGDLLYATRLRDLLVKAVDSPDHMYDDRLLAAADGAFGFQG